MAQKTVCDICERSPNDLRRVGVARSTCRPVPDVPAAIDFPDKRWDVALMCPCCRDRLEVCINRGMTKPVKRGAKEAKVDAETPADA